MSLLDLWDNEPMKATQPTKSSRGRRLIGIGLLLAPFLLTIIAAVGLYAWVAVNGYQGEQSLMYAWFVYAVVFLSYYVIPLIGLSLVMIITGIVFLVSKK